jgi:ubiquinone/menaquinone biosynthesis C-methylase UbiE
MVEEVTAKSQLSKIRGYEKGFFTTHLINLGAKLGIFDTLFKDKDGLTAPDLASALGLDPAYTKTWCETAYHFELVDCDEQGRFKFAPFLDEILGDRSNMRNYLWNNELAVSIGKFLPDAPPLYRSGDTISGVYEPELSRIAAGLTQNIYLAFLYMILPAREDLKQKLEQGINFLDVGCGHANLIVQLALAFPNSRFVGVDCDVYGIEEARKKISSSGLEERVAVEKMGGDELPYEDEFDMASMVVTLHEILPAAREKAVEKIHGALKAGGQLLVLDFPYPTKIEDFRDRTYDFAVMDQFFERFAGFIHVTTDERDKMLKGAGFGNLQKTTIGKGMFELVVAEKQ